MSTQVRRLNLHEYQAKDLMKKYNIRVQRGGIAANPAQAKKVAQELVDTGAAELVIKAQIHAGGRGKGHFTNGFEGGVKVSFSKDKVERVKKIEDLSGKMLGSNLITKQTGPEGQLCSKVLIVEGLDFTDIKEYYVAFLMDRSMGGPVCVSSKEGGACLFFVLSLLSSYSPFLRILGCG